MRYRFSEIALQAGEVALAAFTFAEVTRNNPVVARSVFRAMTDEQDAYLTTTLQKHAWPDFEDVTTAARPASIYDDAVNILAGVSEDDLLNNPNTIVAQVVDSTMIAQAALVVPGKTRWDNYPKAGP